MDWQTRVTKVFTPARLLISLAALLAVTPLLIRDASCGHDFDFHLLSWLEAAAQFGHGSFPQWAYTPAFNAGEPRFIFYPPLSWSLGAILGLVLPWQFVPIAFTWIALTLSGLTLHRIARRYTTSSGATIAGVLYLANPYMLFTAYERTAFAELLAAAWLPLLLGAALSHGIGNTSRRGGAAFVPSRILQIAVPLAALWLTNAPAAVMSTYALAFLTLTRLAWLGADPSEASRTTDTRVGARTRLALTTAAGTILGLCVGAFYIVPAAYERRYVQIQMVVMEGMRVSDHFLFHHMRGHTYDDRFHDAVVRTASLIALELLAAIVAVLLATLLMNRRHGPGSHADRKGDSEAEYERERTKKPVASLVLPLGLLTAAIAFLLTPTSLPVWNHLPDFAFLQFPWRLCALLGLIFALFTAVALSRFPALSGRRTAIAGIVLAVVFIAPAWHVFRQRCDPEDTVPARVALFHSNLGTEATDEYTPVNADADSLHPHDPPYWLIPADTDAADVGAPDLNEAAPLGAVPGAAPAHLTLNLSAPAYLVLNRRQYPAWQLRLNHAVIQPASPERDDGLITLLLPAGIDSIDLTLIRTPDQTIGLLISALGVVAAFVLRFLRPS